MSNIAVVSKNLKLKMKIDNYLLEADYTLTLTNEEAYFSTSDLILYDSTNPQPNDISLMSDIKSQTPLIPVIVLVDQGNVEITVKAMRAGAINVLEIPLDPALLLESIKEGLSQNRDSQQNQRVIQQAINLLQSLQTQSGNELAALEGLNPGQPSYMYDQSGFLEIGDLLINIKQEKAFYQQTPIDLTPTQFRLLIILAEDKGYVITFEELYFRLHGERLDRAASRTALSAHLSYLRTKLSNVGCRNYLENIRGRGYLLDLP